MIAEVCIRFNQVLETWKAKGILFLLCKAAFMHREIIPVEKDLDSLKPLTSSNEKLNVECIEIPKNRAENTWLTYPLKSRYLKMLRNLDKGYKGFAIVKGNEVIGDIWYVCLSKSKTVIKHPDFKLLDIHLNEKDVYMFDMYLKPEERGGGMVNFLLRSALNALKNKGFLKVYGYYTADNIPALWVHRTLGYQELTRLKWQRILFITI